MARNNTLRNVYNRSFAGQNLFEISLVKDENPELAFYKPKHFFFISMAPGSKTDSGGRTFNMQDKITLKCDSEKLIALAESINFWARGHGTKLGKYSIFADSSKSSYGNGSVKACFVGEYNRPSKTGPDEYLITLSFKIDKNKPFGVFWSPSEALAVATILKKLGEKSIELDMESNLVQVGQIVQAPIPTINQSKQPSNDFNEPPGFNDQTQSFKVPTKSETDVKQEFENALGDINIEDAPF